MQICDKFRAIFQFTTVNHYITQNGLKPGLPDELEGYDFNHADISSCLSKCRPQKNSIQHFDTSLYSLKHPNVLQGDPNQSFGFQMAVPLKLCISDNILVSQNAFERR